jgi:hypothetical protein
VLLVCCQSIAFPVVGEDLNGTDLRPFGIHAYEDCLMPCGTKSDTESTRPSHEIPKSPKILRRYLILPELVNHLARLFMKAWLTFSPGPPGPFNWLHAVIRSSPRIGWSKWRGISFDTFFCASQQLFNSLSVSQQISRQVKGRK